MNKQISRIVAGAVFSLVALQGQTTLRYQLAGAPAIGIEGFSSQVIVGKPFSATEERHSLQVLGDGTRIETNDSNRLFRDDQGRTRVERAGGTVTIFDPMAGFRAELHPETRTASRMTLAFSKLENVQRDEARIQALRARIQITQSPSEAAQYRDEVADLEKGIAERTASNLSLAVNGASLAAQGGPTRTFYFAGANPTGGAGGGQGAVTLGPNGPFRLTTPAGGSLLPLTELRVEPGDNGSIENLPEQLINGTMAKGTRTTETIPIGKVGNDRPISVVNERWFSSDLQMVVKSTSSDPRFGDTNYQLTNVMQAPPDPSLFKIPFDYTTTADLRSLPTVAVPARK